MTARGRARAVTVLLVVATLGLSAHAAPAATSTFATGDVFAGVGSNHVLWRLSDGSANKTLTTATSSSITTGMGFDGSGELYVTGYTSNIINRFKTNGSTDTTFGGSFGAHPESISFDRAGNVYVGQATGARSLLKYNAAGTQVASYAASPEGSHGTDRIDLANDQCTVYYTSQGKSVRSFNVCTNTQGPNVTSSLPGKTATDVKILPGGDLLVADTASILRLSPSGSIVKTFDQPSRDCWSTLALGPSATSFWAGDKCASRVYQFDTSSGSLVRSFATGTKTGTVNGLGVSGGYTAGQAPPPPPPSADVSVSLSDSADPVVGSQSYDYVATVSNGGPDAASGVSLSVSVSDNDPNSNASVTDATGTGWTCSTTSTVASCSLSGSLGSGSAAAAVHVTVQAPGATSTGTVTGSASAAASQTDPNTNNNSASQQTTVNPGTSEVIPPSGGTVSTNTGACPSESSTQCASIIYPAGPGGLAGVGLLAQLSACTTLGNCLGQAVNADPVPAGYTDPNNPIKVFITFYSGLAKGRTNYTVLEEMVDPVTGLTVTKLVTTCDVKLPSFPCLESETLDANGNTIAEIWMLSGDPKFQLFN